MGVTEQRMEQLGITLQQTDWRGKGAVEAVLAGDMLYISAHYPVDENGTPVYVGRVGAEIDEAAAYQAARLCGLNMLRTIQAYIGVTWTAWITLSKRWALSTAPGTFTTCLPS
ncbi:MAG: hypothetical protein ACLUOB_02360 [Subdoligranulum sp.]